METAVRTGCRTPATIRAEASPWSSRNGASCWSATRPKRARKRPPRTRQNSWSRSLSSEAGSRGSPQAPAVRFQAEALHHERAAGQGGILRVEPVSLALAEGQTAAVLGAGHGEEEEAQHRGIDDLGAVVEDSPFPIDAIVVLARRSAHRASATGTEGWRSTRRASRARAAAGRPARR